VATNRDVADILATHPTAPKSAAPATEPDVNGVQASAIVSSMQPSYWRSDELPMSHSRDGWGVGIVVVQWCSKLDY